MFGSSALEVAIGIVFVYLMLSMVCTMINELVATKLQMRSKNLYDGVKNLLNDPNFTGLAQQIYNHGLVDGISQDASDNAIANRKPSYMASSTFSMALLDILGARGASDITHWENVVAQRTTELDAAKAADAAASTNQTQKAVSDAQAALDKATFDRNKALDVKKLHEAADISALDASGDLVKTLVAAQRARDANPADVNLQQAVAVAQAKVSKANRSLKGKGLQSTLDKVKKASEDLEAALDMGRTLAAEHPDPLGNIQKAVEGLPGGHTKESLLVLIAKTKRQATIASNEIKTTEHKVEQLGKNIEEWFDSTMNRVSGWYKRWTQVCLLVYALVLVVASNADTIMLAKRFTRDNALRASVVVASEKAIQQGSDTNAQTMLTSANTLDLPLGWVSPPNASNATEQVPNDPAGWILKIVGLSMTVLAVSLGAPFWFDTLSKLVNLRGAGTPPGEKTKSAGAKQDK